VVRVPGGGIKDKFNAGLYGLMGPAIKLPLRTIRVPRKYYIRKLVLGGSRSQGKVTGKVRVILMAGTRRKRRIFTVTGGWEGVVKHVRTSL